MEKSPLLVFQETISGPGKTSPPQNQPSQKMRRESRRKGSTAQTWRDMCTERRHWRRVKFWVHRLKIFHRVRCSPHISLSFRPTKTWIHWEEPWSCSRSESLKTYPGCRNTGPVIPKCSWSVEIIPVRWIIWNGCGIKRSPWPIRLPRPTPTSTPTTITRGWSFSGSSRTISPRSREPRFSFRIPTRSQTSRRCRSISSTHSRTRPRSTLQRLISTPLIISPTQQSRRTNGAQPVHALGTRAPSPGASLGKNQSQKMPARWSPQLIAPTTVSATTVPPVMVPTRLPTLRPLRRKINSSQKDRQIKSVHSCLHRVHTRKRLWNPRATTLTPPEPKMVSVCWTDRPCGTWRTGTICILTILIRATRKLRIWPGRVASQCRRWESGWRTSECDPTTHCPSMDPSIHAKWSVCKSNSKKWCTIKCTGPISDTTPCLQCRECKVYLISFLFLDNLYTFFRNDWNIYCASSCKYLSV